MPVLALGSRSPCATPRSEAQALGGLRRPRSPFIDWLSCWFEERTVPLAGAQQETCLEGLNVRNFHGRYFMLFDVLPTRTHPELISRDFSWLAQVTQ